MTSRADSRVLRIVGVAMMLGFGALALNAETVVWYHFDEKQPGSRHANNGVVTNAAATGSKYNGTATVYNGSTRTNSSWLLPLGVASVPTGWSFYDPMTGSSYSGNNAVALKANNNKQSSWVGVVEVPDGSELDSTGDFTIELFFKQVTTNSGETPTINQVLACRQVSASNGASAIELIVAADGRAAVHYSWLDATNGVHGATTTVPGLYYSDQRWHHMAVTYASSTHLLKLYVDRSLQCRVQLAGALCPTTQPIFIGVNPSYGWGGACENIDEFRYSNAALEPDQFIRAITETPLPLLPETVIYQRFGNSSDLETVGGGTGQFGGALCNEATGDFTFGGITKLTVNGTAPVTSEVYAASMLMTNAFSGTKFANDRATILRPTTASAATRNRSYAWTWTNTVKRLSADDFTYEIIFRMPKGCLADQQYFACEKSSWNLTFASGKMRFRWTDISDQRVDDGRWHQIALVHERAAKSVTCYLDYKPMKTFAGEGTLGDLGQTGDGTLTFGGYEMPHYNETWAQIDLDEIRVTCKALSLAEMLHPGDGVTLYDLDLANAYGWGSEQLSLGLPDFSAATYSYSNEVPYATTHVGIESKGCTNTQSIFFGKAQASGGIVFPDPDILIPRGSFTAELVFKIDTDAHKSFKDDCIYLICQAGSFYIRYNRGDGAIRFCDGKFNDIAYLHEQQMNDGKWHHIAYVQDADNDELRAYFDSREVGRRSGLLDPTTVDRATNLFVNCGCWGNKTQYSSGPMLLNRVRIVRAALRPTEFVTSQSLEGNLLQWSGFEGDGSVVPDYGFGVSATIARFAGGAGLLTDAAGAFVRKNHRSASATGFPFSLNALLERPEQSVEFFLKAASADDGTDLVSFVGASAAQPIWALRKTANGLKVVVTTAAGEVTEVASAGDLPSDWAHFVLTFAPGASSTAVTVYRGYEVTDQGSFSGTLQVEGLPTSALTVGAFDGRVDELRVFKGILAVDDMLHATPQGAVILMR